MNRKKVAIIIACTLMLFIIGFISWRYLPFNSIAIFNMKLPSEDMFNLTMEEIKSEYDVGEELVVDVTFTADTQRSFAITRGFSLINIDLTREGQTITHPSIAVTDYIHAGETITKNYRFMFDEPGTYTLRVCAGFSINNGSEQKEYALDAGIYEIIVKER